MTLKSKLNLVLILLAAAHTSFSQQVDSLFRPQITDNPKIRAMAYQADGKVLIVGDIQSVGTAQVSELVRLNTDGTLDASFKRSIYPRDTYLRALAIDRNGQIVAGGHLPEGPDAIRYNKDGSVDESFKLDPSCADLLRIIPLTEGGYLVFSFGRQPIAKVDSLGRLDTSFKVGPPDSYGVNGTDIAIQADGKVIVAGSMNYFGTNEVKKNVRLNVDGTIDHSFLSGGGPEGAFAHISSIAIQSDNKIILAGSFDTFNGAERKNIVRLMPDGSVDSSFDPAMLLSTFSGGIEKIVCHQGGIICAGVKFAGNVVYYEILKLNADGSLDDTFKAAPANVPINVGVVEDPFLEVLGNDKILFSGLFNRIGITPRSGLAILQNNGSLDTSYNPLIGGPAIVKALAIQPDGKSIIGGRFNYVNGTPSNNIARLNKDGSIDDTFKQNIGIGVDLDVNVIKIQKDGKILLGGSFDTFNNSTGTGNLIRLNPDGGLDNSFTAKVQLRYVGIGINVIEILPNGKILAGGVFNFVNNNDINGLVKLNEDGSLDDTFNQQLLSADQAVSAIAIQSNGNVIVGGEVYPNGGGFLLKTNSAGQLLNNFENINLSNQAIKVIKVFPSDKFVAGGNFSRLFSDQMPNALYQFDKTDHLRDTTSVVVYSGEISDIHLFNENEILLVGSFLKINDKNIGQAVKINLDGNVPDRVPYDVNGYLTKGIPDNFEKNIFYFAGSFRSTKNVDAFNLVKVDLDIPASPENLAAALDSVNATVELHWTDRSGFETGFVIERDYTVIDTVDADLVSFTDTTIEPLKIYKYRVTAISSGNVSRFSNSVTISTMGLIPPAAPTDLEFTALSPSKAILSWTDNSKNETGFKIERSTDGAAFSFLKEIQQNIVTYTDQDFTVETAHAYRVYAFNKFGNSSFVEIEIPLITAIEDADSRIVVYPNPATDFLTVDNPKSRTLAVRIYGMDGTLHLTHVSSEEKIQLNIEDLSSGMFTLKIAGEGRTMSFSKLIKY
jgi:uncharacterized delta-60 repeat protein